jgi:putative cell wall-binding protein
MNVQLIFSIISALVTIGGICVAIGVIKSKVVENAEVNEAQKKQIESCASKGELAAAIKRSDEMLDMMRKRTEEDRATGAVHYKELYGILSSHAERIRALETSQTTIAKTLDEIKGDLNGGFRDIRNELKELRKQA